METLSPFPGDHGISDFRDHSKAAMQQTFTEFLVRCVRGWGPNKDEGAGDSRDSTEH